jgi:predicted RNase H-like HicB family nuclease
LKTYSDVMADVHHLPVVLSSGEDGWIIATCPVIPGCTTQGRTRAEALENVREAIALCLDCRADEGWDLPEHVETLSLDVAA